MKNGTVCVIGLLAALLLPTAGMTAQADSRPAPDSSTLQRQLRHAEADLHRQRAQTVQLRTRVSDLERRSASSRAQLQQRDREIEELRRKLAAMPKPAQSAPVPPGGH